MSTPLMRFEGQTAIITGAARGIGFAAAQRLASEGASIAILDRNGDAAQAAAQRINDEQGRAAAAAWQANVTVEADVRAATADAHARFGAIQILVNNAGIYPHVPFEQLTYARWREIVAVNLDGTFLCCHAVFPLMKAARYGRIVNFASCVLLNGQPNVTAYAAGKAGIIGLSRILAVEAGGHGITVNVVSPGLIETEGALADIGELFDHEVAAQLVKRRGQPADIAELIAYLASPAASFITGQTVNVDGGVRFL
jgi:3-oxoacyl-[acyl-carrier protein] reductase